MSTANTPMMQQYQKIKAKNPGFLLFYRMGDFYELFGDDATQAAELLQITLTSRKTAKDGGAGIPMCGVPFHAAEGYIAKLLKHGHKVALCEQTETPEEAKKRGGYKALVRREVVRLYTGGTLTEESMLTAQQNNYLAALWAEGAEMALAWVDLSTGEFFTSTFPAAQAWVELSRINPQEVLVATKMHKTWAKELAPWQEKLTIDDQPFAEASPEGFTLPTPLARQVCAALMAYIMQTQMGQMPTLLPPKPVVQKQFMQIDSASRNNLELVETLRGERVGSLFHTLNKTVTSAGARLLQQWVQSPLCHVAEIQARQQAIQALVAAPAKVLLVRDMLRQTADVARALSRLTLLRGSPRDLGALQTTLQKMPELTALLAEFNTPLLNELRTHLMGFEGLENRLSATLNLDNLPMLARDGGFVKAGFCPVLDEQKALATGAQEKLRQLEQAEAERTGISSLKVKYNKVWGYYFEVTKTHAAKVPDDFIHRQTTTNSQRFSTTGLMDLERKLAAAGVGSLTRELEIFDDLVAEVNAGAQKLMALAQALAGVDVLQSAAELASRPGYVCPQVDESRAFTIQAGQHPVVAEMVDTFVANDVELSDGKFWLITGPNMAGKSTFLRQAAVLAILAQMGFFVPAKSAHIGVVDRIFTRIGAADDLSRGQSTFMVEMVETATILKEATPHSLVILDEIGRGTATYDGLSIAWACVEHVAGMLQSRTLFATHYHELTTLADTFPLVENHHVAVKEWQDEIVFLHQVKAGHAPGSYGVHVAKLAGMPKTVVARAAEILKGLEKASQKRAGGAGANGADLPLFTAPAATPPTKPKEPSPAEAFLAKIDVDTLTPREAQTLLYQLKELGSGAKSS